MFERDDQSYGPLTTTGVDSSSITEIKSHRYPGILGVNIVKNLTTSVEDPQRIYLACLKQIIPTPDYHYEAKHQSPIPWGYAVLQFGESLAQLNCTAGAARDRYEARNMQARSHCRKNCADMS